MVPLESGSIHLDGKEIGQMTVRQRRLRGICHVPEDRLKTGTSKTCTISENLADIYQALRNFVEVVRGGHEEALQVALYDIKEQFALSWGQKLLGALRALHENRYDTL